MDFAVMDHGGAVEASNLLKHLRDDGTACGLKLARTDPFCNISSISNRQQHHPAELKICNYGSTFPSLLHSSSDLSDFEDIASTQSSFYGGTNSRTMCFLQQAASPCSYQPSALSSFCDHSNDREPPSPFTFSQFRELQHQSLIFKYMMSGVNVPIDLILPIYHSLLVRASIAGNVGWSNYHLSYAANFVSEPGRCRRTDGKKWRCAREVVPDQKYCERHMHRGRNRARKNTENEAKPSSTITTLSSSSSPTSSVSPGINTKSSPSPIAMTSFKPGFDTDTHFPSFQAPYAKDYRSFNGVVDSDSGPRLFMSRGLAEQPPTTCSFSILSSFNNAWQAKQQNSLIVEAGYGGAEAVKNGHEPEGRPLRHFFDDWPRSTDHLPTTSIWSDMEEGTTNGSRSATPLSVSAPPMASSDFNAATPAGGSPCREKLPFSALKLSMSTSGEDDLLALGVGNNMGFGGNDRARNGKTNWVPIVWETSPLAEVLQSTSGTPRGRSKNSGLNLMEGWGSSPRDSPTGVFQNATFGSVSDSGSGTNTPAPTAKTHHPGLNSSDNNIQSCDSLSGTNADA